MEDTYKKLQKLMNSYVPEFAYQQGDSAPGSVLTDLCGNMIEESKRRYDKVIDKHQIQYLNLFDAMLKEPVSAARGYVQFHPVAGYEGMVYVPKGTQVLANGEDNTRIVFETEHDMTAVDTKPEWVAMTDGKKDRIVSFPYQPENSKPFYGFDIRGNNQSSHCLYLCFDDLFVWLNDLDLYMEVKAVSDKDQEKLLEILGSSEISWFLQEPEGSRKEVTQVTVEEGKLHLVVPNYQPQKTFLGQREAFVLCAQAKEQMEPLYIESIKVWFAGEKPIPDTVYINDMQERGSSFLPFGKPLALYQEFCLEDKEVFDRRGAEISIGFHLSYQYHEEQLEFPEYDPEYKAIMKKPRKPLATQSTEVSADYVQWEYLSETGWKSLFAEEHINTLFNGSTEGQVTLSFSCPLDMAEYVEGKGRIRARLIRAEHIYQMPAVYRCPVISGLTLSYSYEKNKQAASYAATQNHFEWKDVTGELKNGGSVVPFYQTIHNLRSMYLGFPSKISGTPFSLYFDLVNHSDFGIQFRVEYLSEKGFLPVKTIDYTDGFSGSGNVLCLIPEDIQKKSFYGYEGYFLRFLCVDQELPDYALPLIKGIYPNMARVVNENRVTEEFYLSPGDDAIDIQLNQQNLLQVKVWVREKDSAGSTWVPWKKVERMYEGGRCYQMNEEEGILHFRKYAFSSYDLDWEGAQIRVEHVNYTGSKANLPAEAITTAGTSIRYISQVHNPFPTYGGYDGYTKKRCMDYVTGMLRTRNRAVTNRDFYDIISQTAYGVRKVKCCNHVDASGKPKPGSVTIAILMEEYEKGSHVFSEMKKQIRTRLMKDSALFPLGRELTLIQPHFVRLNVRIWLEKETMEGAYDLQIQAKELIEKFIDPLQGGRGMQGWEIGEFPRGSQIIAYLRTGISQCNISKILMTAEIDGNEVPVTETFYEKLNNPFVMAVNGEHIVYIEVSEC